MLGQPKKAAALALVVAALALGACGDDEGAGGDPGGSGSVSASGDHGHDGDKAMTLSTFPPAEAETTVEVVMKDFSFDMPTSVTAGKVLFQVENSGSQEHEFVIYQGTKELAAVHGVAAGKSGQLAVVLPAGRYTAKCLVGSGAARHDNLGMVQNFTVA